MAIKYLVLFFLALVIFLSGCQRSDLQESIPIDQVKSSVERDIENPNEKENIVEIENDEEIITIQWEFKHYWMTSENVRVMNTLIQI